MEGNECQRFIKKENLRKLRRILLEAGLEFEVVINIIEACNAVREVYSSCCGTTLDPNHRDVKTNFKEKWKSLVDTPNFMLTWTPKVHYISDHFSDYFEDPLFILSCTCFS